MPNTETESAYKTIGQLSYSDKMYSAERISSLIEQSYVVKLSAGEGGTLDFEKYFTPLSVCASSPDAYLAMKESGGINDDVLHLVENENLDGYGKRVINVGDPVLSSDGANKRYVDETASKATQRFFYAAAGKRDLAQNVIWSTFSFNDSMPQLPDRFVLTEVVIPSNYMADADRSAYLAVYEYADEQSEPSVMIAKSVNAAEVLFGEGCALSYRFDGVTLERARYKLGFVDDQNEFSPMPVMLANTREYSGTLAYQTGASADWFIDVLAVGTAKSGDGAADRLVMTDSGDPSRAYSVKISDGAWSITEII